MTKTIRTTAALALLGMAMAALVGCSTASEAAPGTPATELRLGYFATVTHAPALVGVTEGLIQVELGDTALKTEVFNAGPAAIEALSAGAIDATYIGPNPAINTFIKSGGTSAHVIAGATSGGASLVVSDKIKTPADLNGTKIATPQLGNTQDVALRTWLAGEGYKTDISGGGDVTVTPTENAQTLTLFQNGEIDGAWLPEPWASRLVLDAGAHVLVDERELWPDGAFPTTVLLVSAEFAEKHPDEVTKLLKGHLAALTWIDENPTELPTVINTALEKSTGKPLDEAVLESALKNVSFTEDPNAAAFDQLVKNGITAGTQTEGSIEGLFDLTALNALRDDKIDDAGLGVQK